MRLIDADTLLELPELVDCEKIDTARVREDIVNAPTVDAVPVVRCGECKYAYDTENRPDDAWCNFCNTDNDCFCNYGERKDGEK